MKIIKIFLLIVLLQSIINISYRCGADSIKKIPYKVPEEGKNKKRGLDEEYTPLKIKFDYTHLESQKLLKTKDLNDLKDILEELTYYIESLLSVIHVKVLLPENLIIDSCEIYNYEPNIVYTIKNYDLLIFPSINEELENNTIAQAWTCINLVSSGRPVVGVVEINSHFTLDKRDTIYYMKNILLHEISHVLGFSSYIFKELNLINIERENGITKEYINSPKVLEKAKLHFNCDNIKGIPLENQGGDGSAGSHWEARYMLGDYMISTDFIETTISDITLAYFEDTGYYKVNYYTGGLFRYGKNRGCAFLEEDCIAFNGLSTSFPNEFCLDPEGYFCSSSHISRGDCYIGNYSYQLDGRFRYYDNKYLGGFIAADYCPVSYMYYDEELEQEYNYPYHCNFGYNLYGKIGETIGEDSICLQSSLVPINLSKELYTLLSVCYKIECDKNHRQINIFIGDSILTCSDGDIITDPDGFIGKLKCPEYNVVCTSNIWCNELFDCISKQSIADLNTYDYYTKNQNLSQYLKINLFLYLIRIFIEYL